MRIIVLASGRGTNLQSLIDNIEAGKIDAEITAVISDKADAQALVRAGNHGIKGYHFPRNEYSDEDSYNQALADFIESLECDLICLAGFMRILKPVFVRRFKHKIINIHPSLLPAFPGLNAQRQALEYGVKFTGCTVHYVDEGVDTGSIIGQRVVPVYDDDTEEVLSDRILEQEHSLYPEAVRLIAEKKVRIVGRKVKISKEG